MILAAGRGHRLRPLTDHTPKPLLKVRGKALIQYHLEGLVAAGIREVVINHAWLGAQLEQALGDGAEFNVSISWSREQKPLETGGGIKRALPLLGKGLSQAVSGAALDDKFGGEVFVIINGDVFTDYPFAALASIDMTDKLAHLVFVPNPDFHPRGDFGLDNKGLVTLKQTDNRSLTYSGVAVISPKLFANSDNLAEAFALLDVLMPAIIAGKVSGETYTGAWSDVGTIERLEALNIES